MQLLKQSKMKILKGLYRNGFDEKTSNIKVDKKEVKKILKYFKKIKLRAEERGFKNTSGFNYKYSSYSWKHKVERASDFFIANGDLVQAMHEYGFKMTRVGGSSINCFFNLASNEVKHIEKLNKNNKSV